ncbi:MAG: DNA cytosine methyltransferase [Armatimonadetes bacterium]|nr:DNA cytosine methyltransferase [Armatimonadota bacterium]
MPLRNLLTKASDRRTVFAPIAKERYFDKMTGLNFIDISQVSTRPFRNNKVISLFSGAGGLDLGLEMAGFETAICVEIDADCRATLAYNRPQWCPATDSVQAANGDIRKVSAYELLKSAGILPGELALVAGGPPCQPFSNIGKKEGVADLVNGTLFAEFIRIVTDCRPSAFLFENVEGFGHGRNQEIRDRIVDELGSQGYYICQGVLNAADYCVPQQRKRFIMLGCRTGNIPCFPFPLAFVNAETRDMLHARTGYLSSEPVRLWKTLEEALDDVKSWPRSRSDYALMNTSDIVRRRMEYIGIGQNFKVLPMDIRPNCWKTGKHQGHDTFGRMRLDRPALTIRTAAYNPMKGMYIHPYENRGLSSHEMAAIQSFPPEWMFRCHQRNTVTLVSVGKQIGNAVPPLLGKALGLAIRQFLTNSI